MNTTTDALVEALEQILSIERSSIGDTLAWSQMRGIATRAIARARAEQAEPESVVAWRWSESKGKRWFSRTVDWTHHDKAKAAGCPIDYAYTTPPAAPVAKLEPWMVHARKLVQWRHCMSYNESYFGEPAGLVKQIATELERLMPAAPLKAAAPPIKERGEG